MASVYELFPGEIVIDLATMRIGRVSMRDLLKMTVTVKIRNRRKRHQLQRLLARADSGSVLQKCCQATALEWMSGPWQATKTPMATGPTKDGSDGS